MGIELEVPDHSTLSRRLSKLSAFYQPKFSYLKRC
ncbi:hypothetical protein H6G35_02500 [Aulosira sp. FACHB-113]|nr:hypothetical protein [Aulosira sp. FACHB-113]